MRCLTWRDPFSYGGSSGGHGGGGHAAAKPAADGALGGLSPIVLILGGLGLLVLLGLLAAAVSGGLGRSFGDGFSLLNNDLLSSFDMDSLTETVYRVCSMLRFFETTNREERRLSQKLNASARTKWLRKWVFYLMDHLVTKMSRF